MTLQSQLFHGDPKLEAAAVSDPAHITIGAKGEHVRKIQQALTLLDGVNIDLDGAYGHETAAAVLAYKQKRNIVNRSYQTHADNIVGKMTMASLDSEMHQKETTPSGPVRILPLSFYRVRKIRTPAASVRLSRLLVGFGPPNVIPIGPTFNLELLVGGEGEFLVENCMGGTVRCLDNFVGDVFDPARPILTDPVGVTKPRQTFKVHANHQGKTLIEARSPTTSLLDRAFLHLKVSFPSPTPFVEGVKHDHQPSGAWSTVQTSSNCGNPFAGPPEGDMLSGIVLCNMCQLRTPREFIDRVIANERAFGDKPIAKQHVKWYLEGHGANFVEDDNIKLWLKQDVGIQKAIRDTIFSRTKPVLRSHLMFDQGMFRVEDFRFSFGAIDRVDYEVDPFDDSLHVWFKDRYEWHPIYPGLYPPPCLDFPRNTNNVHAAMVELKASGAADYWMVGEATVPLSTVTDRPI
jgi:hypothetical protein